MQGCGKKLDINVDIEIGEKPFVQREFKCLMNFTIKRIVQRETILDTLLTSRPNSRLLGYLFL